MAGTLAQALTELKRRPGSADGKVAWRFVDAGYTKRAEPDDVIAALRAVRAGDSRTGGAVTGG